MVAEAKKVGPKRYRESFGRYLEDFAVGDVYEHRPGRTIGEADSGVITLTSAYRPGFRLTVPGSPAKVTLPLELTVRDNGAGVPDDLLPHLFDPFFRTGTAIDTGTGLGLAIAKRAVRLNGGEINAENSDEGGLRVIITVPIK